jgi:hypothetical protein
MKLEKSLQMQMKYVLLFLSLIPLVSISQGLKKANLIVIPINGSVESIYRKTIIVLVQNGYKIESSSNDLRAILTGPKVLAEEEITINLDIFIISNKEIQLRGNTFIPNVGVSKIENVGMKGSPARISWEEMNRIARLLGKELIYKISFKEQHHPG